MDTTADGRTLPVNWRSAKDSDGKEYFFNELTGETSWEYPAGVSEAPPEEAPETVIPVSPVPVESSAPATVDLDSPPLEVSDIRTAPGRPGLDTLLGDSLPAVIVVLIASFVLMLQSCIEVTRVPGSASRSYGVAVGVMSLVFTSFFLIAAKFRSPAFAVFSCTLPLLGKLNAPQLSYIVLSLLWVPAAVVLTFFSPYLSTSNGYFACWAGCYFSFSLLSSAFARVNHAFRSVSEIKDNNTLSAVGSITLASIVVLFASIEHVNWFGGAWGVVIGTLSTLISAAVYYMLDTKKIPEKMSKIIAIILCMLWSLSMIILTFSGPFTTTGNGYFGTLAATFFSVSFVYQMFVSAETPLSRRVKISFSGGMRDSSAPIPAGASAA